MTQGARLMKGSFLAATGGLMPCPFCYGEAIAECDFLGGFTAGCRYAFIQKPGLCPLMPKTIPFRTRAQARIAWNTRYGKKPRKKPYRPRSKGGKAASLTGASAAPFVSSELGCEV
jgi:hypothetical protein